MINLPQMYHHIYGNRINKSQSTAKQKRKDQSFTLPLSVDALQK